MKWQMIGALRSRAFQAATAALLVVVVLVLAYVNAPGRPPAQVTPVEKLTVAMPRHPQMALVHVAAAKGFFAEEGLDVTIVPVGFGVTAASHVAEGKADLAVAADVPFVISVMKGNRLGMVASVASISNDNAVIARRDRGIAAPRDLTGKRIGVSFGSSGSYFLWTFLIKNRLSPDWLTLVDLPPERLVAALVDGSVDAVSIWHPFTFQARDALADNALFFTVPDAYRTTIVVFGRIELLKRHAAAMEKLARALLKAEHFMQSRPEEALGLVAQWLAIDAATLRPDWKKFDFRVNLLQSQLIALENEARWAIESGYAAEGPIHNFLPNLYLAALLAVQPDRVTVLH